MNIYLVRHCQAEGQSPDAQLTEEGYKQAERLADFFHGTNIEAIVASPFVRAQQSAIPLANRLGLDVLTDDRLSERILCGADDPNWRDMLSETFSDLDLCYEGGESSREAMGRALSAIQDLKGSGRKHAVVITHGNLMSLVLKHYDQTFGFEQWEALTNPDVYHLSLASSIPAIRRIWTN